MTSPADPFRDNEPASNEPASNEPASNEPASNEHPAEGVGESEVAADAMFDSLLREVVGNTSPPDLSAEILSALQRQSAAADSTAATPLSPPMVAANHNNGHAVPSLDMATSAGIYDVRPAGRSEQRRQVASRRLWIAASSAAALLLVVLGWNGWFATDDSADPDRQVVDGGAADKVVPNGSASSEVARPIPPAATGSSVAASSTRPAESDSQAAAQAGPQSGTVAGEVTDAVPQPGRQLADPQFALSDRGVDPLPRQSPAASIPALSFPPPASPLSDREVLAIIDNGLASYWQALGVPATPSVDMAVFSARLADLFGQPVIIDPAAPLASVDLVLEQPQVRLELARRLAERLLGRVGRERLEAEQREAFAGVLADTFGGGARFDEVASRLLTARGAIDSSSEDFNPAAVWYGALAGPRSVPLVEQFGHAMLDLDLRCGRCHDHPLDERVGQDQYWSLNAVFETGLRWTATEQGGLQLESAMAAERSDDPVVFYELADGRQRAALPRAPLAWLANSSDQRSGSRNSAAGDRQAAATNLGNTAGDSFAGSETLDWIAASLRDNPRLARAAVNRVWELVYGQPLVGSPADPSAPPESRIALQLQAALAEQLRAHDFDLGRLVLWIATASPMRSEVPAALRSPRFESASDEDLRLASRQIQTFAGFPHSLPKQNFGQLLAIASPAVLTSGQLPGNLRVLSEGSALGQIRSAGAQQTTTGVATRQRPGDTQLLQASLDVFATNPAGTADAKPLPVDWLERVGGEHAFQRRAEHLYYLAGYWHPSGQQMEVARLLRGSVTDDSAALRRLWWILTNQH